MKKVQSQWGLKQNLQTFKSLQPVFLKSFSIIESERVCPKSSYEASIILIAKQVKTQIQKGNVEDKASDEHR